MCRVRLKSGSSLATGQLWFHESTRESLTCTLEIALDQMALQQLVCSPTGYLDGIWNSSRQWQSADCTEDWLVPVSRYSPPARLERHYPSVAGGKCSGYTPSWAAWYGIDGKSCWRLYHLWLRLETDQAMIVEGELRKYVQKNGDQLTGLTIR